MFPAKKDSLVQFIGLEDALILSDDCLLHIGKQIFQGYGPDSGVLWLSHDLPHDQSRLCRRDLDASGLMWILADI